MKQHFKENLNVDILDNSFSTFSRGKISGRGFLKVDREWVDVTSLVLLVAVVRLEDVVAKQTLEDFVLVSAATC